MHRLKVLIAAGATFVPMLAAAQDLGWQRFVVPETGALVDRPAAVFSRDVGASPTGFGRRFATPDGRATLTVQSIANESGLSPDAFLATLNPPTRVVYRRVTPQFFALSSEREGKIWYNRCNRAGSYMNCILINYPVAEKRAWDGVVTRISRTLGRA